MPSKEVNMSKPEAKKRKSAFDEMGFKSTIESLIKEMQTLYHADSIPWVIGYSGGKDSTAVLQLAWLAISQLPKVERKKPIYAITTDTLVENPVVSAWVNNSLKVMEAAATESGLPIRPNLLLPEIKDTFWVNLLGKGYPAPRPKFRWCTERMKIKPADKFISNVVHQNGEAIVVLGTRKAESSVRAGRMKNAEKDRVRDRLSPHSMLANALIYSPIEDWSNDDVWTFLNQVKNPWGNNNKDLLTMYQGASPDGECPLVIDGSTPSCGDSRFGCWVCTMVDQDRSMMAMIRNDDEKIWMSPLLKLRNELDEHDHDKRDFRRMTGHVTLYGEDRPVPGPYTQAAREEWLRKLLQAQTDVRRNPRTPEAARSIDLITIEELHEIRRIWVLEKFEIEDRLPAIYQEVTGDAFPSRALDDRQPFGAEDMTTLKELCDGDDLHFQLLRELLAVERSYRTTGRRAKLYKRIEDGFRKHFFEDVDDAVAHATRKRNRKAAVTDFRQSDFELGAKAAEIKEQFLMTSDSAIDQGETSA